MDAVKAAKVAEARAPMVNLKSCFGGHLMGKAAKLAMILNVAILTGCTPDLIAGNETGGMVSHADGFVNRDKAFAVAEANCKKYDKVARISGQDPFASTMTFDCVKP
jgi:hypothetical protein